MKKFLLSLGVVLTSISLNAQLLVNGNWDAPMTAVPGYANVYSTAGWIGFNFSPEATSPFQGAQAAKLTTTNDSTLNAALTWGDDIITGIAQQTYKGTIANPADFVMSFGYKFTKTANDTAFIQVTLIDTLLAGPTDDAVLYFDNIELGASVANWTTATFTMNPTGTTGVANRMVIFAVSSVKGYFDLQTPSVGTTLWIDGFTTGFAGIEESVSFEALVYPNPASDVLNINVNTNATSVSIMGMDGKVISSESVNSNSIAVNVSDLVAGVYFYEVVAENGTVVRNTFVKK
jgi:hypothetical protein